MEAKGDTITRFPIETLPMTAASGWIKAVGSTAGAAAFDEKSVTTFLWIMTGSC
jgi:hypothetical protein